MPKILCWQENGRVLRQVVDSGAAGAAILDPSALPAEQWRDAWRMADGAVVVDMEAARAIHRARLAAVAAAQLVVATNDLAMAEDDDGPEGPSRVAALRQRRQALRAVESDPAIDEATTPAELAAVWPAVLGERPAS